MGVAMGIAGSPRKAGNSTTLLRSLLAGAASAGAETELVYLNDLRFQGCQACRPCNPDGACVVRDELSGVLARLRQASLWALAAPIYFDGISGQMKLFFDRCHHLVNAAGAISPQLEGARAAAIIVTWEDRPREDYADVAGRMAGYLRWMGRFDPIEIIAEGRLGPPEAAMARPDLLGRAEAIGRRLATVLAERSGPPARPASES